MDCSTPGTCAALPHTIVSLTAVWCAHRQAWTIYARSVIEAGAESGPTVLADASEALGPFDGHVEAYERLGELLSVVWPSPNDVS